LTDARNRDELFTKISKNVKEVSNLINQSEDERDR